MYNFSVNYVNKKTFCVQCAHYIMNITYKLFFVSTDAFFEIVYECFCARSVFIIGCSTYEKYLKYLLIFFAQVDSR